MSHVFLVGLCREFLFPRPLGAKARVVRFCECLAIRGGSPLPHDKVILEARKVAPEQSRIEEEEVAIIELITITTITTTTTVIQNS